MFWKQTNGLSITSNKTSHHGKCKICLALQSFTASVTVKSYLWCAASVGRTQYQYLAQQTQSAGGTSSLVNTIQAALYTVLQTNRICRPQPVKNVRNISPGSAEVWFKVRSDHSLAKSQSYLTPAKKWGHRYQQFWINCGRYDQSADDICLSIAWSA